METVSLTSLIADPARFTGAVRSRGYAAALHASWVVPASLGFTSLHNLGGSAIPLAQKARSAGRVTSMISGVPPRHCTLREFGDGIDESQLMLRPIRVRASGERGESAHATVLELIAANAEANAQVASFETVAGRAAMMGFMMATLDEGVTGSSLFHDINTEALVPFLLLLAAVCAAAGSAALAWQASNHVASLLRKGCRNIVDSAVDSIIEGLFFESSDTQAWDATQE